MGWAVAAFSTIAVACRVAVRAIRRRAAADRTRRTWLRLAGRRRALRFGSVSRKGGGARLVLWGYQLGPARAPEEEGVGGQHRVSTGKQPSTFQKTSPRYGFGSSERFAEMGVRLKKAAAVPGPGAYVIC